MPRIRPTPFTKRFIKRTRISKPQPLGNLGEADLRFSQPHNRQFLAHAVLEALIGLPFFCQAAAQGGRGDAQGGGKAVRLRPGVRGHMTQVMLDAAGQALRVAVFDQDIGRCLAEKALQFLGRTLDRQVQALGRKDHARAWAIKTQVVGKHYLIIIAKVRAGAAQFDGQNRDAPPRQPAGDAVHDHPIGEIGECTPGFRLRLEQYDFRQALLAHQLGRQALEHQ